MKKTLILAVSMVAALLFQAAAEAVTWENTELRMFRETNFSNPDTGESKQVIYCDLSTTADSSLRSGSSFIEFWSDGIASDNWIDAYNYLFAPPYTTDSYGYSYNSFSGSFVADGNALKVDYAADIELRSYMYGNPGYAYAISYIDLVIINQTTGNTLFNGEMYRNEYSGYGSSNIVNTPDALGLNYDISAGDRIFINAISASEARVSGGEMYAFSERNMNLSVAVSDSPVAPEPVSSVLFLTGGAFLAGRRLHQRTRAWANVVCTTTHWS